MEKKDEMDPLRAGLKVIRGHGPHFLPVTWRVLDELTDPYDSPVGVPSHSHRGGHRSVYGHPRAAPRSRLVPHPVALPVAGAA